MSAVACRMIGASCRRGDREVLRDVSLDVEHGRVLALVGPNGAGKSSLLGLLAADLHPSAGRVEILGRDAQSWRPRDLAVRRSVLLQANEVSFAFSVADVVEMGRSPWLGRSDAEEDRRAIERAVARADIGRLLDRPFTALSGGEKARVSLARVLAQDTEVVLLDEPTAALDLRHQEEVMGVARELADRGRAVVVVLHDLSVAAAYADRVAVVDAGRLVAHGWPHEVLTPERVEATYGIAVHVVRTPDGHLSVIPQRGGSRPPEFPDNVSPC